MALLWCHGPDFLPSQKRWPARDKHKRDSITEFEGIYTKATADTNNQVSTHNSSKKATNSSSSNALRHKEDNTRTELPPALVIIVKILHCNRLAHVVYFTRFSQQRNRNFEPVHLHLRHEAQLRSHPMVHQQAYPAEISASTMHHTFSRLSNLNACIDRSDIICVGGRLFQSNSSCNRQHKVIINNKQFSTFLIINHHPSSHLTPASPTTQFTCAY